VALSQPLVRARGLGKRELGRNRNLESRSCYRARETLPLRSTWGAVVRFRSDPAPLLRHGLDAVRIREPPAASESVETLCERLSTYERKNRIDPVGGERPRRIAVLSTFFPGLARVRGQPRHAGWDPQTFRRRQLMAAVPFLAREIDAVGALHP
jgi:hypothetical protein